MARKKALKQAGRAGQGEQGRRGQARQAGKEGREPRPIEEQFLAGIREPANRRLPPHQQDRKEGERGIHTLIGPGVRLAHRK